MKVTRIGLLNFWLYDEEEIEFYDGKLLLRGKNGSGKSVTMQSFIPLILDGNKLPSRLDPFGSTDKHIEDYLLGGFDTEQKDEATGYLYLEVYDAEKDNYITVGIGLHAKKGRPVDFWGFALRDGTRIGNGFKLYKIGSEKIPYSKKELKSNIGTNNIFVDKQKDYKAMVNSLLFGFPNIDMYDEFINVLLQLRSPKLSKEYKPTILMQILSSVLQPLSEEDLRPLADAIEEMDKSKEKAENLEKNIKDLSYLMKSFNNYNEAVLFDKANKYKYSLNEYSTLLKRQEAEKQNQESNSQKLNDIENSIENLNLEKTTLESKKENLNCKELDELSQKKENLNNELLVKKSKQENDEKEIEVKKNNIIAYSKECEKHRNEIDAISEDINELLDDISEVSHEVKFDEPYISLKDLKVNKNIKVDVDYLIKRVNNYEMKLKEIDALLIEKEKLDKNISEKELESDKYKKELEKINNDLDDYNQKLDNELINVKNAINSLQNNNKIILFNDYEKEDILSNLLKYTRTHFNESLRIYNKISEKFKDSLVRESLHLQEKINIAKKDLDDKNKELDELNEIQEQEMAINSDVLTYLESKNISYIPFYKAIEFKKDLKNEERNNLESTLLTSGILSSIIVKEEDLPKLKNIAWTFITASTKKENNLTKYFDVANIDVFSEKEITTILESISISSNDLIYLSKDEYKMDFMHGFGNSSQSSIYIGILSRIEAHKREVSLKQEEIEIIKKQIDQLNKYLSNKNDEIKMCEIEATKFPSNDTMERFNEEIIKLESKEVVIKEQFNILDNKLNELNRQMEALFLELTNKTKDITFSLHRETYAIVIEKVNKLKEMLGNVKSNLNDYNSKNELLVVKENQIENTEIELAHKREEQSEVNFDIRRITKELNDIDNILSSSKYKDLKLELENINKRLISIPTELNSLAEEKGRLTAAVEQSQERVKELAILLDKAQQAQNIAKRRFAEEYNLHYVMSVEYSDEVLNTVLKELETHQISEINNALQNYYSAYNDYRLKLNDYHLMDVSLFEREDDPASKRQDILATYQGKQINLFNLNNYLNDTLIETRQIINEQDTKLFHEVLLQSVGSKIREHIESSKKWVKGMNEIMKKVQANSALSIQLEWRELDAASMDEIDTKELVRILKIPSDAVKDSDKKKLGDHFRNKLRRALEENVDNHQTYSEIIFDILDYRNWFEFKMFYERANDTKKELSNKVFSTFSGGEKAKSMYIPLFAAVSAKLENTSLNSLRLVALDEAFAGVDESNIRELFEILSFLNLDYILTSQVLWGDYGVIKDLAITELHRPNNSPVVATKNYRWNGITIEEVN